MGHDRLTPPSQPPPDGPGRGWDALLPPPAAPRRLTGTERADCVVVGAGFTGLAAARRLAMLRPDWRVVVLEASRVGAGAAGRNSGFVVDVWHYLPARGIEGNRRLIRLARHGRDTLRDLVTAHAIPCDWHQYGRLHGAAGERGLRALQVLRRGLDLLGEPYRWLDGAAVASVTGTAFYRAAVHTPGGVLVQPAALARGLAASLPPNVRLFEATAVTRIRSGRPVSVVAADGEVRADRLFVTVNGLAGRLVAGVRGVFPLLTFASLTRPLTATEQRELGGEAAWGLVPEDPMGTTVRRTPDQRILIRQGVRAGAALPRHEAGLQAVRALHVRALRVRFPMLPDLTLAATWGGLLGMTANTGYWFGQVAENLWVSAGCNGAGVALGTALGGLLADLALGRDSDLLREALALPRPAWVPPPPVLAPAVGLALRLMALRSRSEM